jgi:hypothetical protein
MHRAGWTVGVGPQTSDPEARPSDHGPCTLALEPPEKEEGSCGCIISLYYNVNMVTASMRCGSRFEVRGPLIHGFATAEGSAASGGLYTP